MMADTIGNRLDEIKDYVAKDPLAALHDIAWFEVDGDEWGIQEVAFALREIYDALSDGHRCGDLKDDYAEQIILEEEEELDSDLFVGTDPH